MVSTKLREGRRGTITVLEEKPRMRRLIVFITGTLGTPLYLIVLLRLVRDERKRTYNLLRVVNKGAALKPGETAFKQGQDEGANNYRYWTRKAWIIENILRDRVGYYPAKITDNLLNGILEQVQQSNEKPMTFSIK